jgi:hypothetical protein
VLCVQRRRVIHDNHNDLRCRDRFQRGSLPPALRKHAFDAGEAFFIMVELNHGVHIEEQSRGGRNNLGV